MDINLANQMGSMGERGGFKWRFWILLVLFVGLFITFLCFNFYDFTVNGRVKKDTYQAVFLDGGQVYFGHMKAMGRWIVLTDIYYLHLNNQLQSASAIEDDAANAKQNVQLIKLGNEIHGPEDEMYLDRDKILFWENLKLTSQIIKSINSTQ